MLGCAWLDQYGQVQYAETMSEVDGLMLCQAHEPDEDEELDDCYWVASWLRSVGLEEAAEQLEVEFVRVLSNSD